MIVIKSFIKLSKDLIHDTRTNKVEYVLFNIYKISLAL